MKEVWKDIKGWEGRYQVSNLGRVRSLDYTYKQSHGYRTREGMILKSSLKENGYARVSLGRNNQIKTRKRVLCIETGEIYKSVTEASKQNKGNITPCCKNSNRTSGGFHFKYLEE